MAVTTDSSSRLRTNSVPKSSNNDEMAAELETVRLKQTNQIFDQDRSISNFFIVRQGLLGVYRHVYPNKKVLVHKVGPGESIGLAQTMSDRPFPGQLIPIKETVAFKGSSGKIEEFCQCCPADVSRLLADENKMFDSIVRKIDDIIGKDIPTRIAHELLDLASRIGRQEEDGIKIIVKLTRKEISEMIGCAPESVIRVMSKWEKKGWIKTNHKYVTLLRPHSLKNL